MKQPNILLITCHDLGDYLGCYGTPIGTPNIDSLSRNGIQLCNHFSTAPICSPARGSILTGCYPHTNGLMGLVHRGWDLNVGQYPTIPSILRNNGWNTALFGFQHESIEPKTLGYEEVFAGKDTHCENVVPLFEKWVRERKTTTPFYAAMGFKEVHRMGMNPSHFRMDGYPYADPSEVAVPPCMPDIPATRQDLAEFYGAIRYMDHWVGRVLDALNSAGLRENTAVIFTTDHGASFMHSKATLYDGGTRVAFIASLPGALPEGLRVQEYFADNTFPPWHRRSGRGAGKKCFRHSQRQRFRQGICFFRGELQQPFRPWTGGSLSALPVYQKRTADQHF